MEKSKLRVRNDDNGPTVLIGKYNVQESVQYIQTYQIKSVEITYYYVESQIDFLSECTAIESLSLQGANVKNLSGLYHLKALKTLAIDDVVPSSTIDFSQLTTLEEIYGTLPPKAAAIGSLINLKKVQIWDYKPKAKNLKEFSDMKSLIDLELINSNIISLEGIQGLKKLNRLALFRMRTLTDIEAVQHLSGNLTDLEIESAKNIQDFSPIGKVGSLEHLGLNNCGTIPSIGFIKQLPHLRSMRFLDSTVLDGDVSPSIELEHVYFTNKKHYSHRLKDGPRLNDRPTFIERTLSEETESVLQNYNQEEQPLPTQEWRMRMEDGDDEFTLESIAETETVLQDFLATLSHLQAPSEKKIIKKVKEVVLRLNVLNEKYDFFIETLEREELHDFIMEKAQQAGLKTDEDITEEWREW
ncbi:hypothetical protein [Planococcus halotolerans]|uniref:Leucine-rich repeat domain-containing protein n=1 Tax=Planococcus halotolerans TaxID=2233542 RepID=A0A365L1L4_9BACL|nr:hypothetical protein [Planococcus halotolerans]RAZ79336.1 hypothetical protein DP120_06915 [Planococcus halotolerans]